MKRLVNVLVLTGYLLGTAGFASSLHYCGKALTAFSFWSEASNKCACQKKKAAADCCKDVYAAKVSPDQKTVEGLQFSSDQSFLGILPYPYLLVKALRNGVLKRTLANHAPPPHPKIPIFLLLQVFRL